MYGVLVTGLVDKFTSCLVLFIYAVISDWQTLKFLFFKCLIKILRACEDRNKIIQRNIKG